MGKLDGRYAVVTGGGQGIGRAIAQRLLEDGAAGVAILDIKKELVENTARELDAQRVLPVYCNVAERESVQAAADQIYAAFGRVDILVNNAGITQDAIFHKMTDEQWDRVINVNLNGIYNMCHCYYPKMRDQGYGRIVNVSSTSALGNAGQVNYAASKAGVMGLTRSLAKEGARKGVVVNAILPGFVMTDMFLAVPEDLLEQKKKTIPMQRFSQPSEMAAVVSFLASDDVSYMTGQCLVVSGGAHTF